MRARILRNLYRLFPFDLRGDCTVPQACGDIRISCVINFYGRLDLLGGILQSLVSQEYPRQLFEVVLVEDRGGTEAGRAFCESFSDRLEINYVQLRDKHGLMGHSRNVGLAASRGEIILFLDDDTVILQSDFLSILSSVFEQRHNISAVVPHGQASYSCLPDHYAYHEPFFMTSRCTAYRREVLAGLGGFIDDFIGQEDVEFVIRFLMTSHQELRVSELEYFHPPLVITSIRKPAAVGASFYAVKGRYPLWIWFLALLNCSREAPLYFLPGRKNREKGRFGIGFIVGLFQRIIGRGSQMYA